MVIHVKVSIFLAPLPRCRSSRTCARRSSSCSRTTSCSSPSSRSSTRRDHEQNQPMLRQTGCDNAPRAALRAVFCRSFVFFEFSVLYVCSICYVDIICIYIYIYIYRERERERERLLYMHTLSSSQDLAAQRDLVAKTKHERDEHRPARGGIG